MPFLSNLRLVTMLVMVFTLLFGCAGRPDSAQTDANSALQAPRYGHAAVSVNDKIYVLGGSNKRGLLSSIEIIDPKTNETTLLENKIIPRRYFSAVWDGKESIYIFGGVSRRNKMYPLEKTVEVFNTRTHAVTTTTPMPVPRRFNSAVRIDNKIYLAGGAVYKLNPKGTHLMLDRTPLFTVYDLDTQRWSRLTDLPSAMSTRLFVHNGNPCFVGGYDGSRQWSSFACYSHNTQTWQALPDTPAPVSAHSVVTYADKLYVFGDYEHLDQVLMFNFTNNQWAYVDLPYLPSRHNAAAIIDDSVFVTGGNTGTFGPFLDYIQIFNLPIE